MESDISMKMTRITYWNFKVSYPRKPSEFHIAPDNLPLQSTTLYLIRRELSNILSIEENFKNYEFLIVESIFEK